MGIGSKDIVFEEPLLQLMTRLRSHFELILSVRFAYQGA